MHTVYTVVASSDTRYISVMKSQSALMVSLFLSSTAMSINIVKHNTLHYRSTSDEKYDLENYCVATFNTLLLGRALGKKFPWRHKKD